MTQTNRWRSIDAAEHLAAPGADSHKYSRGVLGVRTGSSAYPGAAVLSVEAAWRTGIGMVQYTPPIDDRPREFDLPSPAGAILARRPETVFAPDDVASRARCDAWLIGSGTDPAHRSFAERKILLQILEGEAPVVVDAGALDLVAAQPPAAPTIITPHMGEFRTLWRHTELDSVALDSMSPAQSAAALAQALCVTVLLKGSRTIIASPAGDTYVYGPATPWLATAGTGDVLAGALGSLVATHSRQSRLEAGLLAKLGATAAALHDTAARVAARDSTRGDGGASDANTAARPITAIDVAHALPHAYSQIRERAFG